MTNSNEKQVNNFNKIIAVWGSAGAGKSSFATQLAITLSQSTKKKVLVVDFNTLNATLDHYFGISKLPSNLAIDSNENDNNVSDSSLSMCFDEIEKATFSPGRLEDLVVKCPKIDNLDILTGIYQLNLFEMLTEKHFSMIISAAKKLYDYIIIDVNSTIFVDFTYYSLINADVIYTVTEADYTSLREINRTISYISSNMPKIKFEIIINKYTKKHLDKVTIEQILDDVKVAEFIDYNEKYIKSKIGKKPFVLNCSSNEKKSYIKLAKSILS